jgi:succinoglycan biosynthesis protein ExoL
MLQRLSNRLDGRIEVVIRGTPSALELPDFDAVVAASPHMRFLGRYDRARDLADIYGDVHFAWTIDRFEKGGNGEWALSNRLYEGGLFGAVMIAERDVAMGRWLAARGTGVLAVEPVEDWLATFFDAIDAAGYEALAAAALDVPTSNHIADAAECRAVVAALAGERRVTSFVATGSSAESRNSVLDALLF